jgi:opacity protein-like surface antigen
MKKLLVAGTVALMIATVAEAKDQSISVGGGLNNGHSYSGDYSVDQGYTLFSADYERVYKHFNLGLNYTYSNFNRQDHKEKYECRDQGDMRECKQEPTKYDKNRNIDSHIGSIYVKPYWRLSKSFQPFVLVGAGWDLSDDMSSPLLVTGIGADWNITPKWSLVGTGKLLVGGQRNYRQSVLSVKYTF